MKHPVEQIRQAAVLMEESIRAGRIEQALRHYQQIDAMVGGDVRSTQYIILQVQCGASLVAALAELRDLGGAQRIYGRLKDLATPCMANPVVREMFLLLAFNTMYACLEGGELDPARTVFEDITTLARANLADSKLRAGWAGAASNWVSALAQRGLIDEAIDVFRNLTDTAAAAYDARFGEAIANVASLLMAGLDDRLGWLDNTRAVIAQLQGLVLQYPDDAALRVQWFRCRGSLIGACVSAGLIEEVTNLLRELHAACDGGRVDAEMQETFLKVTGNAVIAFANAQIVDLAVHSYGSLAAFPSPAALKSELAHVRCIAGLHLFGMYARRNQGEEAARIFLEGSKAIKGDENEDTLRKHEVRLLMELAQPGQDPVALLIFKTLVQFAERDRSERRLRQVLVLGAIGLLSSQSLLPQTRVSIYQLLLRLPEAFPEERDLRESLKLMGDFNDIFAG